MSSSIPGFISELIRDANEIGMLGDYEKRRVLDRAVTTIRDMRDMIGARPSNTVRDVVIDLQTVSGRVEKGHATDEQVKDAMLEAASVLRSLKIILDAKDEVTKQ